MNRYSKYKLLILKSKYYGYCTKKFEQEEEIKTHSYSDYLTQIECCHCLLVCHWIKI